MTPKDKLLERLDWPALRWRRTIASLIFFHSLLDLPNSPLSECMSTSTAWCREIGSLTSLDTWNSGAFSDAREPISLHQAVCPCSGVQFPQAMWPSSSCGQIKPLPWHQHSSFNPGSVLWNSLPHYLQCILLFPTCTRTHWIQYKFKTHSDIPLAPNLTPSMLWSSSPSLSCSLFLSPSIYLSIFDNKK